MECFLAASEWLIKKCSVTDTQKLESANYIKSLIAPKYKHYTMSFPMRIAISVLIWNHKDDWYQILEELLPDSNDKLCDFELKARDKVNSVARNKASRTVEKIKRNKERRMKRTLNKIDPRGHQYKNDPEDNKPKRDPTRFVACDFLPSISNSGNNCFIISTLQLIRFLKQDEYLHTSSTNVFSPLLNIMKLLNNGNSITKKHMDKVRNELPRFNDTLQHDAVEFFGYLLQEIHSLQDDAFDDRLKFEKCYMCKYSISYECANCSHKTILYESSIINYLNININGFEEMCIDFLQYEVTRTCEECAKTCIATVTKKLINNPEFLFIAFSRWKSLTEKINDDVIWSNNLKIGAYDYSIIESLYHKGEFPSSGH